MSTIIKTKRSWGAALFGAFFAVPATLLFALSTLPDLYDAVRMQAWIPAQATLSATELKYYSGKTTTYKTTAKYHYQTDSGRYQGSRVSIHSGSDNIGNYHKDMARKLQHLNNANKYLTIYYDPERPQDSIIDRNIRWESLGFNLIFVILFGGIGFGIIYSALFLDKINIAPETTDKPWLAKPEWIDNKITSNSKMEVIMYGVFALFWNLISLPMAIFGLRDVYHDKGVWIALIMMLVSIAGLYVIHLFLKKLFEWRRFGRTYLTLNPFPGSIGGQVAGTIAVNARLSSQDSYKVNLSCINKYTSTSEKGTGSKERKIWQKNSFAHVLSKGESSELAFLFNVPDYLPESDIEQESDSYHLWKLSLTSKDKCLERNFEIPVFATAATSSLNIIIPKHHLKDESAAFLKTYLPLQTPSAQGSIYNPTEEIKIHYPLFNRPLIKLITLSAGVIFAGIGFTMHSDAPAFFSGLFIFSGGAMALPSLYFLLSSLTVVLDTQSVTSTKRFLGIFPRHKKALFSAIKEIKSKVVMSTSSGKKETNHYEIMASLQGGNDILLAHQIEGEEAKELIVDYFYKTMKISKP